MGKLKDGKNTGAQIVESPSVGVVQHCIGNSTAHQDNQYTSPPNVKGLWVFDQGFYPIEQDNNHRPHGGDRHIVQPQILE